MHYILNALGCDNPRLEQVLEGTHFLMESSLPDESCISISWLYSRRPVVGQTVNTSNFSFFVFGKTFCLFHKLRINQYFCLLPKNAKSTL